MKELLIQGAAELGIRLNERQTAQLLEYAALLKEWNGKMNLTAITDDEGIAVKHFLDSMTAVGTGHVKGRVIDVGTGAGFPGVVLKVVRPDIRLTLLDSLQKRLTFLEAVAERLALEDVEFVHARAEDGGRRMREQFDTVVSRAVANMTVLSELCLPFLKPGGRFLALKGPLADEELEGAKRAIHILGGAVESVFEAKIPFSELSHRIIIVKKVRQTPMQYPRKAGIPSKSPIDTCYNLKKSAKK